MLGSSRNKLLRRAFSTVSQKKRKEKKSLEYGPCVFCSFCIHSKANKPNILETMKENLIKLEVDVLFGLFLTLASLLLRYNIRVVQSIAVQCKTVHCSALQCSTVQCSAEQCSAIQCSAVQFSAV